MKKPSLNNIAKHCGFWKAWAVIEDSKVNGKYLDNMEVHYCEMLNALEAGQDAGEVAKRFGGKTLRDVLVSVKEQALEDFELRSFDQ